MIAMVVLIISLAGCGGSSRTPTRPLQSAQPTRASEGPGAEHSEALAEFISKAQAICLRRHRRLTGLTKASLSQVPALAAKRGDVERHVIGEMQALRPPAQLDQGWRQIIAYTRTLAGDTQNIGEDARVKNVSDLAIVAQASEAVLRKMSRLADGIGLHACSRI